MPNLSNTAETNEFANLRLKIGRAYPLHCNDTNTKLSEYVVDSDFIAETNSITIYEAKKNASRTNKLDSTPHLENFIPLQLADIGIKPQASNRHSKPIVKLLDKLQYKQLTRPKFNMLTEKRTQSVLTLKIPQISRLPRTPLAHTVTGSTGTMPQKNIMTKTIPQQVVLKLISPNLPLVKQKELQVPKFLSYAAVKNEKIRDSSFVAIQNTSHLPIIKQAKVHQTKEKCNNDVQINKTRQDEIRLKKQNSCPGLFQSSGKRKTKVKEQFEKIDLLINDIFQAEICAWQKA
jgi:hypothetical protein